jgi:type VI protein secretion system component VasK
MNVFTSQAQWMIVALVFVLGMLIGMFLTAGGRRKWKTRYREETHRREGLEKEHRDHLKQMEAREKEWHDREKARPAVVADRSSSSDRDIVVDERTVPNRRTGSRAHGDDPA